jgi:pimeloyl-ACP methyl ester carboxylesterase
MLYFFFVRNKVTNLSIKKHLITAEVYSDQSYFFLRFFSIFREIEIMRILNSHYTGANNRKSLIDLWLPETDLSELVLFIHGYKGFKDWGAWNNVQAYFVRNGVGFAKLNLSHNGGTLINPIDFPDLDAFGQNRYSFELTDIEQAIEWLKKEVSLEHIPLTLLGHSRGGGIAILAGSHPKVKRVITWAAIDDIAARFPKGAELEAWRKNRIRYVENARTNQEMPHEFSFYEDYIMNKELLNIQLHAEKLKSKKTPCLHIHGANDEAVEVAAATRLAFWTGGKKIIIHNTGHTFDTKHPWENNYLPEKMAQVCKLTLEFIRDA